MEDIWDDTLNIKSHTIRKQISQWLNRIGQAFSNIPIVRKLASDEIVVKGPNPASLLLCKPDIVHYLAWPERLHAFGELTSRDTFHSNPCTQKCSLAIYGHELRLCIIDREGTSYQKVDLEGEYLNALAIIRIIAGFMCGDPISLGGLTQPCPTAALIQSRVEDKIYCVIRSPLESLGGVPAYLLSHPKIKVVIKDSLRRAKDLEESVFTQLQGILEYQPSQR